MSATPTPVSLELFCERCYKETFHRPAPGGKLICLTCRTVTGADRSKPRPKVSELERIAASLERLVFLLERPKL